VDFPRKQIRIYGLIKLLEFPRLALQMERDRSMIGIDWLSRCSRGYRLSK